MKRARVAGPLSLCAKRRAGLAEAGGDHLLLAEELEDVPFLQLVETVEGDAAVEAILHLGHVLLEPLEVLQAALEEDLFASLHAHLEGLLDLALGDEGAGDDRAADLE